MAPPNCRGTKKCRLKVKVHDGCIMVSSTSGCCQPLHIRKMGLKDSASTANNREPQLQPCKSDSRTTLFILCAAFCDSLLIKHESLFHANTLPFTNLYFPTYHRAAPTVPDCECPKEKERSFSSQYHQQMMHYAWGTVGLNKSFINEE